MGPHTSHLFENILFFETNILLPPNTLGRHTTPRFCSHGEILIKIFLIYPTYLLLHIEFAYIGFNYSTANSKFFVSFYDSAFGSYTTPEFGYGSYDDSPGGFYRTPEFGSGSYDDSPCGSYTTPEFGLGSNDDWRFADPNL